RPPPCRFPAARSSLGRRPQPSSVVRRRRLLVGKKKAAPEKTATARRSAPQKEPTAGRRKAARAARALPVPIVPEEELAAHFPAVEAAAREGQLNVRVDVLDDPQKKT